MLNTIHRAINDHRILEIEYESPGKPVSGRWIDAYTVALFQASLYVIGINHDDEEKRIRTWKLDRFHSAVALDKYFKFDETLDIDQYLSDSLGIFVGNKPQNFRIRLSTRSARWVIEEPWHPEQQVRELKNGQFELTVRSASEMEIIPRVLQLGKDAEILAPASARRAVTDIVRELAGQYGVGTTEGEVNG
jgi:predicted DNA-binding transcriptional regulator YafY